MGVSVPRTAVIVGTRDKRNNDGESKMGVVDDDDADFLEEESRFGSMAIQNTTPTSTMSSFRNHRVIIASLFLPTTVVITESGPSTPEVLLRPELDPSLVSLPAVSQRLATEKAKPLKSALAATKSVGGTTNSAHTRQSSASGPLRSIVDDLKDKSRNVTPAVRSPSSENANPFTKLTRFAEDASAPKDDDNSLLFHPATPPTIRKHQTTHADGQPSPRLQRRKSRSTTRRPHSLSSAHAPPPPGGGEDLLSPPIPGSTSSTKVTWYFEPSTTCNGGLRNAVESVSDRMRRRVWVGALGTYTDGFGEELRREIDERMLSQRNSVPVWIPDDEFQSCYDEFCHQVLWPCLHYAVPDAPKTKMFYESASYKQYVSVNKRFASLIQSIYQDGDIIFINDYHLMLLPLLLRNSLPLSAFQTPSSSSSNNSTPPCIGFFMHVAFPSSEIFRCLSMRQDLLMGVLGADLVGFQTVNYARHFRQTVSRILAFEALPKGIQMPEDGRGAGERGNEGRGEGEEQGERVRDGLGERGRFVDVGAFPMGIDVVQLEGKRSEPEVAEWVQVLKQRYAGMKMLVGRDKLDEIQGVRHKILAFEAFLDKYPAWQGRVVLIQVALQTTESNELAGGVSDVVSRINSRFSTLTYQPVVFLHTQDLTFSQYLALLTVGDAFIVTSLREGMALRTHEWVECQEGRWGALVLSEFTGSYSYSGFRSCIAVNPWDTRGTANAIHQALTMPKDEALSRWEDLHNHVTNQTAQSFITSFLNRCLRSHSAHLASLSLSSSDPSSVPPLDLPRLLPRYKHSNKRLILVDFEGTLWRRDLSREGVKRMVRLEGEWDDEKDGDWPRDAVAVLQGLVEDWRNEVWVLSGLGRGGVLGKLGKVVPGVGIVAENGCFIKTRSTMAGEGQWISMVANFNLTWKSSCLEILSYFTERTPGAFIEEREASVVWRFWSGDTADEGNQDRQWARRQAAEAQNHIFDSLGERYGLRIIPGKNSFLVLPNNISRSTAVGAILHPGGPARSPLTGRAAWMSPDSDDFGFSPISGFGGSSAGGAFGSSGSAGGYRSGSGYGYGSAGGPGGRRHSGHESAGSGTGGGYAARMGGVPVRRYSGSVGGMGGEGSVEELDFMLAVSSDERLLRRLNEFDGAETVSTSGKGTDARWRVGCEEVKVVLGALVGV